MDQSTPDNENQDKIVKAIRGLRKLVLITLAICMVAVSGVGIAVRYSIDQSNKAQAFTEAQAADRVERSRGSCIQFNVNQFNTREAQIQGLVETYRPLVPVGKEADFVAFAASLRSNVEHLLPYRDCSPAGIDEFLKNPPADPAVAN